MSRRPLGGDDRRVWVLAGAASLLLVAVAAGAIAVALAPRSGPGVGSAVTDGGRSGGAGSSTATPRTSAAPVTPATPVPRPAGSVPASPTVITLPAPLSGPGDRGPRQVPLTAPNGPADVARLLFGSSGVSCGSDRNTYLADCAVSRRFGQRLQQLYGAGQPYEPLCRCQAAWSQVAITSTAAGPHTGDGNYAAIAVTFTTAGKHVLLTLLVERTIDGWLAADSWCGSAAGQDIYLPQPPGCGAS